MEEEYNPLAENTAIATQLAQKRSIDNQNQYYQQEQETNLAEAQLECETTLTRLYHQLRQDFITLNNQESITWNEIKDQKKRRLTDDGVNRIMELMSFYVNKENLLSNFNEEQINGIMLRFRLAFSANILMRYKLYFRQPTFEECKAIFLLRIEDKRKLKLFAGEMAGVKLDSKEIEENLLKEYENRIEQELAKIKEEKKKEMLSEFEMLFEQLSQLVFATLNRAWKGEERGSIRRHTNISEVIGNRPQQQKESGGMLSRWKRN